MKVSGRLGLLRKSRTNLNTDVLLQLYKSLIMPYFDYGDFAYSKFKLAMINYRGYKYYRIQHYG